MSWGGLGGGGVVGVSGWATGLGEVQKSTCYLQVLGTPTRRKLKEFYVKFHHYTCQNCEYEHTSSLQPQRQAGDRV